MRSARQDIATVEGWGYSHGEALAFVTRRAVAEAGRVTEEAGVDADRAALEAHLRYLGELKGICQSMIRNRRATRGRS